MANANDVVSYVISYVGMQNFAGEGSKAASRSSTSATIVELEEFVSYNITVQAVYNTVNVPTTTVRVKTWSDSK